MDITKRFIPEHCPGCKARIEAKYSAYRHAPQHVLFYPLLLGGVVLLIVLSAYLIWTTAMDTIELLEGLGLQRKERGMVFFAMLVITAPLVTWVARIWWRYLHRLPRQFTFECPACRWEGPIKVIDLSAMAESARKPAAETVPDELPAAPDPMDPKHLRRQEEMERRQQRMQQEQPPNPDFDFGNR